MNPLSFKGSSSFNVLYFSDVHNNSQNLKHFKSAVDEFDRENKDKNTLKLSGGDINFASDVEPNLFTVKLMNSIGLDACCIGNHEIEGGDFWAKAVEKGKPIFKFLSSNLLFSRPNEMQDKIAKSAIIHKNGEKVGVIGVVAPCSDELIFKSYFNDYFSIENFDKTALSVKKEVKNLENQGINKIFLLAHTGEKSKHGFDYYKHLAKIGGIDVIIGGHDHFQVDKWYKSERNEPVKVISTEAANDKNNASEDLGTFGVFNSVFDVNGVLEPDNCKNTVKNTKSYPLSSKAQQLEEKILQNNKVISYSDKALTCTERKTQENPVADLLTDSMLWIAAKVNPKSKVQIALMNAGEIKADLPQGNITIKDLKTAFPFTHNVTIAETDFTKKQIFEALNKGIETTTYQKQTLGLLQVGGLRYTVGSDKKAKDVYLLDKDGNRTECLDNMPEDKKYKVVYDTFLMQGAGGMDCIKKELDAPDVKIYPYNHQSGIIEYLKHNFHRKSVEVKTGRIEVEN